AAENLPLLAAPVALLLQDSIGAPLPIGVQHQRPPLQLVQRLAAAGNRLDIHRLIRIKPEVVHAAEGRRELVLLADGLPQGLDLDATGLLTEASGAGDLPLIRIKGIEEAHR